VTISQRRPPLAVAGRRVGGAERDTVVLPCAGAGGRLGLPFGKELLPVGPGRVVLDVVFDLLAGHADRLKVALVVSADREPTVRHVLARHAARLPVCFLPQDPQLPELTGAVASAAAWFGPRTVVLLPDQLPTGHDGGGEAGSAGRAGGAGPGPAVVADPVGAALRVLDEAGFCFLAAREHDPVRLAADGALRLADGPGGRAIVVDYRDKPGAGGVDGFDAVWFGYGFRREHAPAVLAAMAAAAGGAERPSAPPFRSSVLYGCPVVEVGPFLDLGTWPALRGYWARSGGPR
jgi:hypothetical protein